MIRRYPGPDQYAGKRLLAASGPQISTVFSVVNISSMFEVVRGDLFMIFGRSHKQHRNPLERYLVYTTAPEGAARALVDESASAFLLKI